MNNPITPNDAYTTPSSDVAAAANDAYTINPNDVAAAATIASTALASITAIVITGQKTAGVALAAAIAAAKASQLPTTINAGINDEGTVATKINQDQATEI